MKTCIRCHKAQPDEQFYKRKLDSGRWSRKGACKTCESKRVKDGRVHRSYMLRTLYGITLEQHDALLESQGGVCAICGATPEQSAKGALAVDHCHTTGKVRGLLCGNCNVGIGQLRDDPKLVRRAAEYLERFQ